MLYVIHTQAELFKNGEIGDLAANMEMDACELDIFICGDCR